MLGQKMLQWVKPWTSIQLRSMSISSYNRVSKQLPRITLQLIRSKNTEDKIVEGNFRLERTLKSQEKEEINHHQI
jgi:hypothetical protein